MEESPHKCPTCGRSFNQRSNLKTHLLTHTDLKPYKCATCSAVFRRNCDLRRHMLTHSIGGHVPPERDNEDTNNRNSTSSEDSQSRSHSLNTSHSRASSMILNNSSSEQVEDGRENDPDDEDEEIDPGRPDDAYMFYSTDKPCEEEEYEEEEEIEDDNEHPDTSTEGDHIQIDNVHENASFENPDDVSHFSDIIKENDKMCNKVVSNVREQNQEMQTDYYASNEHDDKYQNRNCNLTNNHRSDISHDHPNVLHPMVQNSIPSHSHFESNASTIDRHKQSFQHSMALNRDPSYETMQHDHIQHRSPRLFSGDYSSDRPSTLHTADYNTDRPPPPSHHSIPNNSSTHQPTYHYLNAHQHPHQPHPHDSGVPNQLPAQLVGHPHSSYSLTHPLHVSSYYSHPPGSDHHFKNSSHSDLKRGIDHVIGTNQAQHGSNANHSSGIMPVQSHLSFAPLVPPNRISLQHIPSNPINPSERPKKKGFMIEDIMNR